MTHNLVFLAESLGDTMARAGLNTLMGISIVFCTLAFIAIIIALEGKVFTTIDKKKAQPKVVAEKSAPAEAEELVDDTELVAVITAAIYAFEAEQGNAGSANGLVVRSIRRRG